MRQLVFKLRGFGILYLLNLANLVRCVTEPHLLWVWLPVGISGGVFGMLLITAATKLSDAQKASERCGPHMRDFLTAVDHLCNAMIAFVLIFMLIACSGALSQIAVK
jgi:hypothetical protein